MLDRTRASLLGIGQSSAILGAGVATVNVDTTPVTPGNHWYVDQCSAILKAVLTATPALGDEMDIDLCPPGTQAPENGVTSGTWNENARPLILARGVFATFANPFDDYFDQNALGTNLYVMTLRVPRPFSVPQGWFLRAVSNIGGNSGGITSAKLILQYQYVIEPNC